MLSNRKSKEELKRQFYEEKGVRLSGRQALQIYRHYQDVDLAVLHLNLVDTSERGSQAITDELLERDPLGISLDLLTGRYSAAA